MCWRDPPQPWGTSVLYFVPALGTWQWPRLQSRHGSGGHKPHFCGLQPLNSLGPAQRRLCAALAELVTGAAAKQVVVTALLGVLLACWERPSSCLERRVEPAWPAWVLQEPQALLDRKQSTCSVAWNKAWSTEDHSGVFVE